MPGNVPVPARQPLEPNASPVRRRLGAMLGTAAAKYHALRERWRARDARQRRRHRRILAALVAALLAYPVLGTLALWTGFVEWALGSEDLHVNIDRPAYTIFPGRIYMDHVLIAVNGETQFTLEARKVVLHIAIFPLAKRHLQVLRLRAEDARYRMRVQVESDEGMKERLAAYPPLPELPGAKVIKEQEAAQTEPREPDWTVMVDALEARVVELWFMEYRYLGDGTLRGGFVVGPNRMRVASSVQDLGPGELRFGPDHVVARSFGGRVSAEIPDLDPNKHADESFLDFVTARILLGGDVENLQHLDAYLDGQTVQRGKGRFDADLVLDKGHVGRGSKIRYQTDTIRLLGVGFGLEGDLKLDMGVAVAQTDAKGKPKPVAPEEADLPHVRVSARASYISLAKDSKRAFTIQVLGHEHEAVLKSNQIGSKMSLARAQLNFPEIFSKDFDDLGAALSDEPPTRFQRGEARASLKLDVDDEFVGRGTLRFRADDVLFGVAGMKVGASLRAQAGVRADLKHSNVLLERVGIRVFDGSMRVDDEHTDDWWLNLESERLFYAKGPPQLYEATFGLHARDAEPVLEALAEKDQLSDIIPKLTKLKNLRAAAIVRGKGEVQDIMVRSMESKVWDTAGRIWSKGDRSRMAIVFGGKAVSLGIASDGERTEIRPFARHRWLNEKLSDFPAPLEQVVPSKP